MENLTQIPGINRSTRPAKLYKYMSVANDNLQRRAADVIRSNKLWFSSRVHFNDPFDSRPQFDLEASDEQKVDWIQRQLLSRGLALGQEAANRLAWEKVRSSHDSGVNGSATVLRRLEERMDQIGITCLAGYNDHILLWSHYGDSHKGICVEFQSQQTGDLVDASREVRYQAEYPVIDLYGDSHGDKLKKSLLVKSDIWRYEMEYRVFSVEQYNRAIAFDEACLTAVYFGANLSQESKDMILGWVKQDSLEIEIYQACLAPRKYAIEFERVGLPET